MLGIALLIIGLVLMLVGYFFIGLVVLIVGLVLCFAGPYSYGYYHRRRL